MSKKSPKIAQLLASLPADGLDPHYAGYFACFNRGLFYEAHDVLEELWLKDRLGPDGNFYKGLIQLAGAFVHLQKMRHGPAIALFRLARKNLASYPIRHQRLDLDHVLKLMDRWVETTEETRKLGRDLPPLDPHLVVMA